MVSNLLDSTSVQYTPGGFDSVNDPIVLFTVDPQYFPIILFRTCQDYKNALSKLVTLYPNLKQQVDDTVKNTPDPTCL